MPQFLDAEEVPSQTRDNGDPHRATDAASWIDCNSSADCQVTVALVSPQPKGSGGGAHITGTLDVSCVRTSASPLAWRAGVCLERQGGRASNSPWPWKAQEAVEKGPWPSSVLVRGGRDLPASPGDGRLG